MKQNARSKIDSGNRSWDSSHGDRGGTDGTRARSDLWEELRRLREENDALRSGKTSTELVRLRKENQSLRAELSEQKQVFRLQLGRIRQEKRSLKEQIVALHAEKLASARTAGAGVTAGESQ